MTSVEVLFRYAAPPTDAVTLALANIREVYGIRRLSFDRPARTLCVEYDATRLNAAAVEKLVRQAGLEFRPRSSSYRWRNSARALARKPLPCAVVDRGMVRANQRLKRSAESLQIDLIDATASNWTGSIKPWLNRAASALSNLS